MVLIAYNVGMTYTSGLWLFILSSVILASLILYSWQFRKTETGRTFIYLMLCAFTWAFFFRLRNRRFQPAGENIFCGPGVYWNHLFASLMGLSGLGFYRPSLFPARKNFTGADPHTDQSRHLDQCHPSLVYRESHH